MILYALTIFLSAFLLFQVQPLIAKIILPWFGGSAAVWTICMLFFQLLLLAGYVYSHAYVRLRIPARRHIHIALLAVAAATLPLAASTAWHPEGGEDPTWRILGLLATSVGLPYFVLSTTAPWCRPGTRAPMKARRLIACSRSPIWARCSLCCPIRSPSSRCSHWARRRPSGRPPLSCSRLRARCSPGAAKVPKRSTSLEGSRAGPDRACRRSGRDLPAAHRCCCSPLPAT